MRRPDHLFLSVDGNLYDTRDPAWMHNPPLRYRFSWSQSSITTANELKACLRAGNTTDLGGYPLYFVDNGGDAVSFDAVRADLRHYLAAYLADDWMSRCDRMVACEVNYEDNQLTCVVTGERIPSAYAEDNEDHQA